MKRNSLEAQRWPCVNFSSQLKHRPLRRTDSSSDDRRLYGIGDGGVGGSGEGVSKAGGGTCGGGVVRCG